MGLKFLLLSEVHSNGKRNVEVASFRNFIYLGSIHRTCSYRRQALASVTVEPSAIGRVVASDPSNDPSLHMP